MGIVIESPKGKHLTPKQKFIKFVLDSPLFKETDQRVIARREREAKEHMKFLEKHKVTKKELKEWFKNVPKKHKQEAFSLAATMLALTVPTYYMSAIGELKEVAYAVAPIAGVVEPYAVPLFAAGVGTALAYDLWHTPHSQVRAKLKKLGKWADHEIDWIMAHLKRHKKKNPKMFHGVKRHHMKKLHKVM